MDIPEEVVLQEHKYNDIIQIDYIAEPITYQDFFTRYLQTNRPCIFGPWATETWKSRSEWIYDDKPNLSYLSDTFGEYL